MEGQSLEGLDERGYECVSETLAMEETEKILWDADCPPRLLQVALLLAEGMTAKEIRVVMGISQQGVSKHKKNLKKFLECHPEVVKILRM